MDPICHTLVGACLAQGGLKRRTRFGTAVLLVAANVPDVDVLAGVAGRSLELRRGVTHGVLALSLWPLVVGGLFWLLGRRRPAGRPPAQFSSLVLLAAIGVFTHPALDYLNTYGMRWLMPFRDRWFYGDTLFIVDPWVWLALSLGLVLALRRERQGAPAPTRPARVALAATVIYIGAMMGSTLVARREVLRVVGSDLRVMVAPRPFDPFAKDLIVARGDWYLTGRYRFGRRPALTLDDSVAVGLDRAVVARVAAASGGPAFLHWARFPVGRQWQVGDSIHYQIYDRRYSGGGPGSWASFVVTVPDGR